MSSLYRNKEFATFWNLRAGDEGEPYKRYVLDPLMLKKIGLLKNKVVLELGCGNGYLATRFLRQEPKKVIMMDLSRHNLEFAKTRTQDPRVSFLQQDATKKWHVPSTSVDVVYSIMMLNEVKNIRTPLREAYRSLRPGGQAIIAVTHPAWDLFVFAQDQAGKPSAKIKNLGNYFRRGFSSFVMSGMDSSNPHLTGTHTKEFEVEHFQRPFSDYLNEAIAAGFRIKELIEPPLTPSLLKHAPRFAKYNDHPIGLVFWCEKNK